MGKPVGGKRRSSGNVAGRYLAAIGAGGCGEMEDPTLSPLAACVSREQTNGLDMRNNAMAFKEQQQQHERKEALAAPKTPTKKEQQHSSYRMQQRVSPHQQHLNVQPSPSVNTATTTDAYSWATSAASPSSRKGRATPSRSPSNMNTSIRTSPSQHHHDHQSTREASRKASTSFFSTFPSAKIALPSARIGLRSSASKRPPQTLAAQKEVKEGSSSSSALAPSKTRPQHLQANSSQPVHNSSRMSPTSHQSKQPLSPRQHGASPTSHQAKPAYATSETLSDVFASEGAPTEVMNNRSVDMRRYVMDPAEDALIFSNSKNRQHHSGSGYYDEEDDLAEEKKQDSDQSTTSPNPKHHQPRAPPHETSDEDLLLFGPVPLERSNTRRTSNRGKFSQPDSENAYPASSFPQSPYGQHVLHSRTRPQKSPQASPSRQQNHHHASSPRHSPPQQPRTSPRLNRLLNGDNCGQEGYVRRKGKDEIPVDTKSLLSNSTHASSSEVSPTILLTILDKVKTDTSTPQQKEQTKNGPLLPKQQTKPKNGHWWSADRFKLKPRVSPPRGQTQQSKEQEPQSQSSQKAKAVVAYPESLPSYSEPETRKPDPESTEAEKKPAPKSTQKKESSPTQVKITVVDTEVSESTEVNESFNKSDVGTIGLFDDSDEEIFGPKPAPVVPKLAPCKIDPHKKTHTASQSKGPTQQQSEKASVEPPKVNLKPRKNRVSTAAFEERSIVSESSVWTPLAMSEDGLNFSPENDAPLLPLFSQDRLDLFREKGSRANREDRKRSAGNTTKLEDKLNAGPTQVSEQYQQRQQNPQNTVQDRSPRRGTKPSPVVSPEEQKNKQQGSRPNPSPEIWRRGENDEMTGLTSPDPIFCTQPSASQTVASSTNLSEDAYQNQRENLASPTKFSQPISQKQPSVSQTVASSTNLSEDAYQNQSENLTPCTKFSQPASQKHGIPVPPKRWPKVETHVDGNRLKKKDPPGLFQNKKHSNLAPSFNTHGGKAPGIPKRSVSGPSMGFARWGHTKGVTEQMDDSSRLAETGADTDTEKSITSTGSVPRRAKSEQYAGKIDRRAASPLRGSFRAAFAAFEKAHAGREAQALFPGGQLDDEGNESIDGLESKNSFVSSRLAMVLQTHLSMEETGDQQHADTLSVDVQSIRSNFEGVAPLDEDADDDDTASVKSLREVFENADSPETAVSKMRAFFNATKAPVAKDFETGNSGLKEAWNKFETATGPRQKRQFAKKGRDARPPLGNLTVPTSVSVAARARRFGAKETVTGGVVDQERRYSYEQNEYYVETRKVDSATKHAMGSPPSQLSSSDSGVISSIEGGLSQAPKDLIQQEIAWKTNGTENSEITRTGTDHKTIQIPIDGDPSLIKVSDHSAEMSIPSDRPVLPTETGDGDLVTKGEQGGAQRPGASNSNASSGEIISPPRLGIQSGPWHEDRFARNSYLPKDFTPTVKPNARSQEVSDKDTLSASEGEFSDGVTLDLSLADVSQLTDPTALHSKAGDESTVGDISTGETLEIDEASSSQQTEAAAPLFARALKRLSDDLSLESRNQIAKLWQKSGLLANYRLSKSSTGGEEESKSPDLFEDSNGWDLRCVEASFPSSKGVSSSETFFGFDGDSAQEWQSFEKGSVWPEDPFSTQTTLTGGRKTTSLFGSSRGQSRDPDGIRIDGQMNASVHITEAKADKTENTETTGPTTQESKEGPAEQNVPILSTKDAVNKVCDKPKSPPRMYDVRSRVYTQAKQHAKSRLAARSSPTTAPEAAEKPCSSPPNRSPTRETSTTPPPYLPATPVLRQKATSAHPVTPPSRSRTPTFQPATPPIISRTPSLQPLTPTQRAVTPTMNNLRGGGGDDESRITPKVSHRRGDVHPHLREPSSALLDAFPASQWKPQSGYAMPSPRLDELNQETSIPLQSKHDENSFPSNELPSATFESTPFDEPSSSVFESSPIFTPGPDSNNFPATPKRFNQDFQQANNGSPGRTHHAGMFSRTHPTSHDSIRQRKETATANIQAFKATPPREQTNKFIVPPSPKGGRLAAVVGKHAALMARLKVLKAARMQRSSTISPPHGQRQEQASSSDTTNTAAVDHRPKTSIGRAIASVYKSRRSAGYRNPQDNVPSPSTMERVVFKKAKTQPAPETEEDSAFDPFFSVEDSDDLSESTWSSTHFGGRAFVAALEVE